MDKEYEYNRYLNRGGNNHHYQYGHENLMTFGMVFAISAILIIGICFFCIGYVLILLFMKMNKKKHNYSDIKDIDQV